MMLSRVGMKGDSLFNRLLRLDGEDWPQDGCRDYEQNVLHKVAD
jgi:hypothetical protein